MAPEKGRSGMYRVCVCVCVCLSLSLLKLARVVSLSQWPDAPRKMVEKERKEEKRLGGYPPATSSEVGWVRRKRKWKKEVTEEGRTEDDNDGRLEQCNACVSDLCRSALPLCHAQTDKRPVKQVKSSRVKQSQRERLCLID